MFFLICIFFNLLITLSFLTKDPKIKPVINAPVVKEPVTKADFKAKFINFITITNIIFNNLQLKFKSFR